MPASSNLRHYPSALYEFENSRKFMQNYVIFVFVELALFTQHNVLRQVVSVSHFTFPSVMGTGTSMPVVLVIDNSQDPTLS